MSNKDKYKAEVSPFREGQDLIRVFVYSQSHKEFIFQDSGEAVEVEEVEEFLNLMAARVHELSECASELSRMLKREKETRTSTEKAPKTSSNSTPLSSSSFRKLRKVAHQHNLTLPKLIDQLNKEELVIRLAETERERQRISDNIFLHQRTEIIELRQKLDRAYLEVIGLTKALNEERNHNHHLYVEMMKQNNSNEDI